MTRRGMDLPRDSSELAEVDGVGLSDRAELQSQPGYFRRRGDFMRAPSPQNSKSIEVPGSGTDACELPLPLLMPKRDRQYV